MKPCLNFSEVPMVEPIFGHRDYKVYNPYPSLGAPEKICWPRGFPIDLIQKSWNLELTKEVPLNDAANGKIGILQSLADFQPDVDALFRLTRKTPFIFQRPPIRKPNGKYSHGQKLFTFTKQVLSKPVSRKILSAKID